MDDQDRKEWESACAQATGYVEKETWTPSWLVGDLLEYIEALQAELADMHERADVAAGAIDVVLIRLPVPDNDNRKRLRVARDILRGASAQGQDVDV